jgi:hypothetical protein
LLALDDPANPLDHSLPDGTPLPSLQGNASRVRDIAIEIRSKRRSDMGIESG